MKMFQRHRGNFAVALGKLAGAEPKQILATPAQAMDERRKYGADWGNADICVEGAWYNASFNEVGGRILGTRGEFNPLIDNAEQAVKAMRTGEFYLEGVLLNDILLNGRPASEVLAEIAEQDAKKPVYKRRVVDLAQTQTHQVQTDSLGDDDAIVFLAESKTRANKYGLFLRNEARIKEVTVYMQPIIGKDKSRGCWFGRLDGGYRSEFGGNRRNLGNGDGSVFGVYEGAEGASQKISARAIRMPSLSELLEYSKPFVPQAVREDFEKGLRAKFEKQ
jgi:hypothetical protein